MEARRVRVGQATLAYRVVGQGEPVALIHGLAGSTRWWGGNIAALATHHRVYLVDLVGFGNSRGRTRFALAEAATILERWLDLLGQDRVALVGHSMGGLIAAELAADVPDRVSKLVLVNAAALPLDPRQVRRPLNLAWTLHQLPPRSLPILVDDARRAGPRTLWRARRDLLTADIRPKLGCIQAPTLLIWGAEDRLVPLSLGEQLQQAIPRAALAVIPNAGHVPMWERPQAFNQLVGAFLTLKREQGSGGAETVDGPASWPPTG